METQKLADLLILLGAGGVRDELEELRNQQREANSGLHELQQELLYVRAEARGAHMETTGYYGDLRKELDILQPELEELREGLRNTAENLQAEQSLAEASSMPSDTLPEAVQTYSEEVVAAVPKASRGVACPWRQTPTCPVKQKPRPCSGAPTAKEVRPDSSNSTKEPTPTGSLSSDFERSTKSTESRESTASTKEVRDPSPDSQSEKVVLSVDQIVDEMKRIQVLEEDLSSKSQQLRELNERLRTVGQDSARQLCCVKKQIAQLESGLKAVRTELDVKTVGQVVRKWTFQSDACPMVRPRKGSQIRTVGQASASLFLH